MYVSSRQKTTISLVIDVLSSEESGWIQTIGSIYGREAPTGLEWIVFFQPGPGVAQPFFFFRVWILRSEMLFQMKRCGEYAEGWAVCVGWLGFVAAGSCMDDTWDWIKSVIPEWDMNARLDRKRSGHEPTHINEAAPSLISSGCWFKGWQYCWNRFNPYCKDSNKKNWNLEARQLNDPLAKPNPNKKWRGSSFEWSQPLTLSESMTTYRGFFRQRCGGES